MNTARQAAERYIVYTGEECMYFDTEAEAIAQAERDIKGWRYLARCDCEWSEEVERVAVFRMIAFAEQTVSQNDYGTEEWDYSLSTIDNETTALRKANTTMLAALKRQHENIKRWLETGIPANAEESKSIAEQIEAAIKIGESSE